MATVRADEVRVGDRLAFTVVSIHRADGDVWLTLQAGERNAPDIDVPEHLRLDRA